MMRKRLKPTNNGRNCNISPFLKEQRYADKGIHRESHQPLQSGAEQMPHHEHLRLSGHGGHAHHGRSRNGHGGGLLQGGALRFRPDLRSARSAEFRHHRKGKE